MGATECGQKIVEGLFVSQIDSCESQHHANLLGAQQVVGTYAQSEKISRSNSRRIVIIIFSPVRRNSQPQSTLIGISALPYSLGWGGKSAATV